MSALWFLHSIACSHSALADVLTQEVKLNIWVKLIKVVRKLLENQSGEVNQHSQNQTSPHSELDTSRERVKSQKRKGKRKYEDMDIKENNIPQQTEDKPVCLQSVNEEVELLRRLFSEPGGKMNESVSESVTDCSNSSKSSTGDFVESVPTAAATMFQLKCAVFTGTLETERYRLLLQQTEAVMAAILLSFEIEQFREVIRQLEHDVVRQRFSLYNCPSTHYQKTLSSELSDNDVFL